MKNKRNNYGNIYNFANKNKRIITGIIGGALAFMMVIGVVASALM